MTGSDVETTVEASIETNMPSKSPERASSTARRDMLFPSGWWVAAEADMGPPGKSDGRGCAGADRRRDGYFGSREAA